MCKLKYDGYHGVYDENSGDPVEIAGFTPYAKTKGLNNKYGPTMAAAPQLAKLLRALLPYAESRAVELALTASPAANHAVDQITQAKELLNTPGLKQEI